MRERGHMYMTSTRLPQFASKGPLSLSERGRMYKRKICIFDMSAEVSLGIAIQGKKSKKPHVKR